MVLFHLTVTSFELFTTKEMALLSMVFAYTGRVFPDTRLTSITFSFRAAWILRLAGLELTFFSSVYETCLGHAQFSQAKSLAGMSGIFIGIGEITGETDAYPGQIKHQLL